MILSVVLQLLFRTPLTIFGVKDIPETWREMIEAAIEKGGRRLAHTHEAWVATDSLARRRESSDHRNPKGERRMLFAIDEEPAEITSRVKETLDG